MFEEKECFVLLTALLFTKHISSAKACLNHPVCLSYAIHRTINMDVEQEKMSYFIKGLTPTIPEGSEGHLIYVNDKRNEVATFVVENQIINFTYVYEQEDWKPTGYNLSAIALEQAANMCYTANDNEGKAEVNFLLISDFTKLQGFPPLLLRKKTFVIVFGSGIPDELKSLASSRDHIYLIKDSDNVTAVVDLVSKQVCKDIHYPHNPEVYPKRTVENVLVVVCICGIIIICSVLFVWRKNMCVVNPIAYSEAMNSLQWV